MKKIVSIALVVLVLAACFTVFASATDAAAAPENVMKHIVNDLNSPDGITLYGCKADSATSKLPACAFDGNRVYNKDDTSTYGSWKFLASRADIEAGSATLYNADGEEGKADSKYLGVLGFQLDQIYSVSSMAIYLQNQMNTSIESFDLLVSETGAAGTWKVATSFEKLTCGKQGGGWTDTLAENNAYMVSAEFDAVKAGYIAIGIVTGRCVHLDAMVAAGTGTELNAPHYFRITELEVYGVATGEGKVDGAETTTPAPETTTAAPETEEPKDEGGCGGSIALLSVAAILAGAACVVAKKRD